MARHLHGRADRHDLAAQPGTPIRRLVLNDVGPFIPRQALARIGDYVGKDPRFADLASLEAYLRLIYRRVGVMDDGPGSISPNSGIAGFRTGAMASPMTRRSPPLLPPGRLGMSI